MAELADALASEVSVLNGRAGSTPANDTQTQFVLIAQWIEQLASNQRVGGSNPSKGALRACGSRFSGSLQLF